MDGKLSPLKILLASDHYPPFVGGAQRQTKVLAHSLVERGHQVVVATVWQDNLPALEAEGGVDVRRLKQLRSAIPVLRGPARRRHQPPFPDPVTVRQLRALIEECRPDVIHAAGWYTTSVAAAVGRSGIPLLLSARDYGFSCPKVTLLYDDALCSGPALGKCLGCAGRHYGAPRGWIATLAVLGSRGLLERRMTGLHSVSHFVDEMMQRDFIRTGAGAAVPREVIPSFRIEDAEDGDVDLLAELPADPFILFVGALRPLKGLDVLLRAYEQLDSPPALVLVGTREPDTPSIPAGVVTLDGLPHSAVLAAWERSLFGVMPSRWPEPLGSVVHEAMSRGRAVIGTRPGGHEDMIEDGESGLLVPSGDVHSLREAMQRLIDDGEYRDRLGARAAERADEFTAEQVVPKFEALYRQLVDVG